MKYYYGFFRNNDTSIDEKGQLFKAEILVDFQNTSVVNGGEVLLASSPFSVEYNANDTLYKPYKCSTATVRLLQRDYNFDFNNISDNNVVVKLLKFKNVITNDDLSLKANDKYFDVEWVGYATPNAYNQLYDSYYDEFELECQDALSTLKYIDYDSNNGLVSFKSFIEKCMEKMKLYNDYYITDCIPFSNLAIQEKNFYDENNKPKKYLEILEEICTYLNLTAIAFQGKLYLIQYDAVKQNYSYFLNPENQLIAIKYNKDITKEDIAETNIQLSLTNTYKNIKVNADLYAYDKIYDDNDKDNWDFPISQYPDYEGNQYTAAQYNEGGDVKIYRVKTDELDGVMTPYYTICDIHKSIKEDNSVVWLRFHTDNKITTYHYADKNKTQLIGTNIPMTVSQLYNTWGATPMQYFVAEVNMADNDGVDDYIDNFGINFQNAIYLKGTTEKPYLPREENYKGKPLVKLESDKFVIGKDNYIVINGSWNYQRTYIPYNYNEGGDVTEGYMWEFAMLKCGDVYWNGTNWIASETLFKLPQEYNKDTKGYNTDIKVKNTVGDWENLNIKGYKVPSPVTSIQTLQSEKDAVYYGTVELYLYTPIGSRNDIFHSALVKNLSIEIATKSDRNSIIYYNKDKEDSDSNTTYKAEVENKAVEEGEDINLDIATWDNKKDNFSQVLTKRSESVYFGYNRLQEFGNTSTGYYGRAEEHIINNFLNQYSTPTQRLEININGIGFPPFSTFKYHFFNNKTFVLDSQIIDYEYNKTTINILEKK